MKHPEAKALKYRSAALLTITVTTGGGYLFAIAKYKETIWEDTLRVHMEEETVTFDFGPLLRIC